MLDASPFEYYSFFERYSLYIHSLYFSLPLGKRFHTREYIADQFEQIDNIKRFWSILEVAKQLCIPLELVLNTNGLSEKDIYNAFELLYSKNIAVDYINILDKYYDCVKTVDNSTKLIYSYNNFLNSMADIPIDHNYEYIVIGGKNIRNFSIFSEIHNRSNIIFLLNNGCNHFCDWCKPSHIHCKTMFDNNRNTYSIEELYAIQSIMPYELTHQLIPLKDSDLLKINCRNANMMYLEGCLISYVNDLNFEVVYSEGRKALSYWSRLAWFYPFFDSMNLEKIMQYKDNIYKKGVSKL